jgi:DNA-binding MltR family transcriptional regulator
MPQDKKAIDKVFQFTGALGTFAAKIDMAYLNGLVSKDAYEDLKRFKDIRNDFAHELDIRNFNSESIKVVADLLKLIDEYVAEGSADAKGAMKFMELDVGAKPAIFAMHAEKRKKLPRERYLMTAQLFAQKMSVADLKQRPLPFI